MDFDFLFDRVARICSRSASTSSERRRDASFYDLLASEARLAQFRRDRPGPAAAGALVLAGPPAQTSGGEPVLLSWSGSMFEYLMPLLVMPTYDNTLLDQTCQAAVAAADRVRAERGVPWGISESGYNATDVI